MPSTRHFDRAVENLAALTARLGAPPLARVPFLDRGHGPPDLSEAARKLWT